MQLPILGRQKNIHLFIEIIMTLDTLITITVIVIGAVLVWTIIKDKEC